MRKDGQGIQFFPRLGTLTLQFGKLGVPSEITSRLGTVVPKGTQALRYVHSSFFRTGGPNVVDND